MRQLPHLPHCGYGPGLLLCMRTRLNPKAISFAKENNHIVNLFLFDLKIIEYVCLSIRLYSYCFLDHKAYSFIQIMILILKSRVRDIGLICVDIEMVNQKMVYLLFY